MAWPPTTTDILNVVEGGVFHRADTFRFELLDKDEQVIGELHPRADTPPTISWDSTRTLHRTIDDLHLPASEVADINPVTDRVRPVMVLQNGAEFPLGVLVWAVDDRALRSWGPERASSMRDKLHILVQPRGVSSTTRVGWNMLNQPINLARSRLPAEQILVVAPSGQAAATPMSWDPNTPMLEIMNAHLAAIGYLPAHFDNHGRLVLRPAPVDLDAAEPDLVYNPGGRIIADSIVTSDDLLDAPNAFVVYDTSGQNTVVIGRYDVPATAPHSQANRGYPVIRVEAQQGLANAAQANAAAKTLALTEGETFAWAEFDGVADPRHDAFSIVRFLGQNYLEVAWRLRARSGEPHHHVLRRIY